MAKYVIIGLNGPVDGEGNEDAYNRWYDEVHVPHLKSVPAIVSARRFKVLQSNTPWPYAVIYEIETDDLASALKAMGTTEFDPSFDRANSANIIAMQISD